MVYDISKFIDISREDGQLNLFATLPMSRSHGPGRRFVIWTQGCFKRCPGCINPQMQEAGREEKVTSISSLVNRIDEVKDSVLDIEGITIQGGEPFLQAETLATFLEELKQVRPELNVLFFSGYSLNELKRMRSPAVERILEHTDTLIDGVFEKDRFDNERIAGSTNQNIHHLGEQRLKYADFGRRGRETIIHPGSLEKVQSGVSRRH